jgi:chitinase
VEKHIKFTAALYAFVLSLVVFNFILKNVPSATYFTSPIHRGYSVLAAESKPTTTGHTVYGFLPYWKLDSIDHLQLEHLTDIAYFALRINKDGNIRKLGEDGNIDPGYNQWKNNQKLSELIEKTKLSGKNFALTIISHEDDVSDSFLNCEPCWKTLGDGIEYELAQKGITDINFDFEYAGYTDEETANKYTKMVAYMNNRLDKKFGNSNVVVSTFADSVVRPRVTKVDDLSKISDGIFIMAYDFHRPTSDRAGPIAPIEGAGIYSEYDITTMLKDYLANIPPSMLILGVPYYGYNWVVTEGQPYSERVQGSDATGFSVSQTYENIMNTILEVSPAVSWDDLAKAPYFSYISKETGSQRIVYFENGRSIETKFRLAKDLRLKGIGIWALGYDGGYQELWNVLDKEFVL